MPIAELATNPAHLRALEALDEELSAARSCSTRTARLVAELAALAPQGDRRMGANPHANGGLLLRDLKLPDIRDYAVEVAQPGAR